MIVIDASLAFDIAIATHAGKALSDRLMRRGNALAAPEIIELEFLQTLRRFLRHGEFQQERADNAMRIFAAMEIERFSHSPLRERIWALRENLTAYDAAYFALAELLGAPLWTRDRKFASVSGHAAHIEIV